MRPDRTPARAKPLTPTQRCQLSYWTKLGEDAGANERFSLQMSTKTPAAENYTDSAIGGSKKYCARLEIHTAKMEVRALFYSFKDDSLTETMAQRLDELERAVGAEGVPFKAKTASGIRFTKTGCNISGDRKRWSEFIAWQLNAAVEIKQVADAMLRHCGGR